MDEFWQSVAAYFADKRVIYHVETTDGQTFTVDSVECEVSVDDSYVIIDCGEDGVRARIPLDRIKGFNASLSDMP